MDVAFLADTFIQLLAGVPMTLLLVAASLLFGGAMAVLFTAARTVSRFADALIRVYCFVFRGSPLLVQIFLIYYGLGQFAFVRHSILWPLLREPLWCAILALSLSTAAYTAEILRGGLAAVSRGAREAARVTGMSTLMMFRRIVFPIALRQGWPAYGNEIIIMVKSTAITSIITVMEITGIASAIATQTYRSIEVFLCAGVLYLIINIVASRLIAWVERRLNVAMLTDRS